MLASTQLYSALVDRVSSTISGATSEIGDRLNSIGGVVKFVPVVGSKVGGIMQKLTKCVPTNDTAVKSTISQVGLCVRQPLTTVVTNLQCLIDDVNCLGSQFSSSWSRTNQKFLPMKAISAGQNFIGDSKTQQGAQKAVVDMGNFVISIIIAFPSMFGCNGVNILKNVVTRGIVDAQYFAACAMKS